MEPALLRERFLQDQQGRKQGSGYWEVEGIMDWEEEEGRSRRVRILGLGQSGERMLLTVFGPFRQVMMQLLVDGPVLRLIRIGEKEVVEVPATARGMLYLTRLPIVPARLIASLLGFAEVDGGWSAQGAPAWTTEEGETLFLDPSGRIQKRQGRVDPRFSYGVTYTWPEEPQKNLVRPKEVRVNLEEAKSGKISHLDLILSSWKTPDPDEVTRALQPTVPEGFRLLRPLLPEQEGTW